MQRLLGSIALLALLTIVGWGCGSTDHGPDGNDATVIRFVSFDGTGLDQTDSVFENNAQVDVEQNRCETAGSMGGEPMISDEPFTETVVNATFFNNQKLDIRLDHYTVHVDDPEFGSGDVTYSMSGNVVGGRCAALSSRSCASNQDCAIGATIGLCNFGETTIPGLKLVDLDTKARVQPRVYGRGLPVQVTFFGSDVVGNNYKVTAGYTVTFDNFCNCGEGDLCIL
jgi:hypothetical protein